MAHNSAVTNNEAYHLELQSQVQRRRRLFVLKVGSLVLFVGIAIRLTQIQIIEAPKYAEEAQRQYQILFPLPALRGTIYDRNGNVIASNSISVSFAADPKIAVKDSEAIASTFSTIFNKSQQYYLKLLRSKSRFQWLERKKHIDYLAKIENANLKGIIIQQEPKRLYHYGHLIGQLVGFTNIDNVGISGIELGFDRYLQGKDGYVILQRDGRGNARHDIEYPRFEPVNGCDIHLTIDMHIQAIAQQALKQGVEKTQSEGGIVIVLNPKTGEVLAIAQYPTIDPDNIASTKTESQRLRAITDVFEPGSLFKLVTASAALEYNLLSLEQKFYAEQGMYVIPQPNGKVRRIIDVHGYDWLTLKEAMEQSSNIVMAKVSDIIGAERFYKMARAYGFGIATTIEIPGEVNGSLNKPTKWSSTTLNTIAFGYEVGTTPIQIAAAYAAVANEGILMKPYILKKIVTPQGDILRAMQPQQIRRVISSLTAQKLRTFLQGVVENGTGKAAKITNISVAGKTGTSKKHTEGVAYIKGNYVSSFVGFFPAEHPQMVCLVMLDCPQGPNYYGGVTCAPIFKTIAEKIINTTDWFSTYPQNNNRTQEHLSGSLVQTSTQNNPPDSANSENGVPNVTGLSVRRALNILMAKNYHPIIRGSGVVVQQKPDAGSPSQPGMSIMLVCQPLIQEK